MSIPLIIGVLAVYFLGMVGIGWYGRKYAQTFESFTNAGRNCGAIMLIGTCVGSQIGNGFVVGGAGDGSVFGMSGAWYGIACGISYLVSALFVNKKVYEKGFISLPEFLQDRYHDKTTSAIFCAAYSISSIGIIGAQIMAGSALFTAFGMNGALGAVVITLIVLAYSSLAGLWGSFATSVVQVVVIIIALVATFFIVLSNGGVEVINQAVASGAVPENFWDLGNRGIQYVLVLAIPVSLQCAIDQCNIQRINSCKSEKSAFVGYIWSFIICVVVAFMPTFIGMYGVSRYGVTGNSVFFAVAMEALPPLACAMLVAAVVAAIMSTIDSLFVAVSTVVLKNVYQGFINPNPSEKTLKIGDKICTICFAAIALVLSLQFTSIIDLLGSVYAFISACAATPFLGGLFWKRGTRKGAIWSAIVGCITVLLSLFGFITLPLSDLTPTIIAAVVYVVVSLMDKKGQEEVAA